MWTLTKDDESYSQKVKKIAERFDLGNESDLKRAKVEENKPDIEQKTKQWTERFGFDNAPDELEKTRNYISRFGFSQNISDSDLPWLIVPAGGLLVYLIYLKIQKTLTPNREEIS